MRWWCGLMVVVGVLAVSSSARAQATRTWVSGVGDDANPCSRTAPCKTFTGAISKTAPAGEIDALDPGGFGAVTITKSITIDGGGGVIAGVLVSGTNGIVVSAGATDNVVIRNLDINGLGTGLSGVRFLSGGELHVEKCVIYQFTNFGIDVELGATGKVFVSDTIIRDVVGSMAGGIFLTTTAGTVNAAIDHSRLHANGFGLHAKGNVVASVRDSDAIGNVGAGFWADTSPAEISFDGSRASSDDVGVRASAGGIVRILDFVATGNTTAGLLTETGGQIIPFSGNEIAGNPPGGITCEADAASATVPCPSIQFGCPAPVVQSSVGPCKKCRTTKGGVTNCKNCQVNTQ